MIAEKIADLDVSAASGAVVVGGELFVVADDELFLAVYALDGTPRRRTALFTGDLPEEPEARKAAKPDLEALALLPDGALLALGSGSRPTRRRGARFAGGRAEPIDLRPLYERLLGELPDLNIEGAAVCGDVLRLLSRGNGPGRTNAAIDLSLAPILESPERPWGPALLRAVRSVDLPDDHAFTDAEPDGGDRLLFAAAAEDSPDTYRDGPVRGSIIGLLDGATVRWTAPASPQKIEGLARHGDTLFLVTDADDRSRPAELLRCALLGR